MKQRMGQEENHDTAVWSQRKSWYKDKNMEYDARLSYEFLIF